eukprot:1101115-Rhodomonas_salina.1
MDPFFSKSQVQAHVNWSIVLKLYLAAAQHDDVLQECWVAVVRRHSQLGWDSGCASETIHAVLEFMKDNGFDATYTLKMVERSVRSVEHNTGNCIGQ